MRLRTFLMIEEIFDIILHGCGALAVGVLGAAPELASGVFAGLGGAEGHPGTALGAGGYGGKVRPVLSVRRVWQFLFSAVGEAGGGELLAVASAFDEALLQSGDLAVEVGGGKFRRAKFAFRRRASSVRKLYKGIFR
jgi:hypothetical protein